MPFQHCDYIPVDDNSLMQTEWDFCYGQELYHWMTDEFDLTTFKLADILGPERLNPDTKVFAILFSVPT